jgi:O-antigen/teichoic acid export membrane protein
VPEVIWLIVPAIAILESVYNMISHYIRVVREHMWLYAAATVARSVLYIGIGYFMVSAGYSYIGLLLALLLSFLIPSLFLIFKEKDIRSFSKKNLKKNIRNEVFAFGLPIIIVMGMQTAIASTDNILLAFFIGAEATGQFAVALDLVIKTLIFLMVIIHRTTYPLTVKYLEHDGLEAAKKQYNNNAILLFSLAIPACAGLSILAKNISYLVLGEDFREISSEIIPFIVMISFLNCFYQFYLSPAYQLSKKTRLMVIPIAVAFISNIIASSFLIPHYEIYGAIAGSFIAYLICVLISLYLIKNVFPLPFPLRDIMKIVTATLLMSLAIVPFYNSEGAFSLFFAVGIGGIIYVTAYYVLNVGGYRPIIASKIKGIKN